MDNNFKIVTPVYNAEKWIKKCIDSVKEQTYRDFEMVIINDCSTDNTAEIITKEIAGDDRFTFINNEIKKCALENTVRGIHYLCSNAQDIVVILDGDDWLADNDVLAYLNMIYQDDIWTTWGQFELLSTGKICKYGNENWCGEIPDDFNRRKMNRFYFSHLRTYKYDLFCAIKDKDLKDKNGKYYTTAGDVVIALPIIEMAGPHHRQCIKKVMYVYNNNNELNDMKLDPKQQIRVYNEIRNHVPYRRLIR